MSQKVSFTAMEHGTQEDYDLVMADETSKAGQLADRVLEWLRQLDCDSPYHVTRLGHSLQTATRAERDGAVDLPTTAWMLQALHAARSAEVRVGTGVFGRAWEAVAARELAGDLRSAAAALCIHVLQRAGIVTTVRWSRGLERDAACGQLRVRR